jgi:HK97 family phage prohead protease
MPWTVEQSAECPESRPWAVVKDSDGSVEGCHATEADANAQLVALNIAEAEGRAYESLDFKPPKGVREEAAKGLAWRREYGRGGTEVGIARARDLANGRTISPETARRIKAYFDRHQSDKEAEGYRPGERGYPSNGRIAAALWGGFDDSYPWATKLVRQMNAEDEDRSESMDNLERRFLEVADADELAVEPRANGQTSIVGYAAVYNRLSLDLGGFREEILPGAFDKILNRQRGKADVVALFNHDNNIVLGRTSSGTLELSSDAKGLRYVVTPPMSRQDVVELISRRDVFGSSFAFTLDRKTGESFRQTEDGKTIRQVREVSGLYDVGPVLTPAYPASSSAVAMRSYKAWLAEQNPEQVIEEVAARSQVRDAAAAWALRLRNV